MIGDRVYQVALGLPISEARAEQLALNITTGADTEAMESLVELILAIAPPYRNAAKYPDPDAKEFELDLSYRGRIAKVALGVLFTSSDAFLGAFIRYLDKHKQKYSAEELVKEIGLNRKAAERLANKPVGKRASKPKEGK
jgi:hypothetical protein